MVVESYSYDVFGAPTVYDANYTEISKSAIGNPYMFTARRADDETALYYYRARYYAFDIGRFLQTDPIGYSDGLNVYAYVENNPVNLIDPMGLCKEDRSFLTKLWEGDYVGTQYGSAALDKYAYEIAFGNASWYNYAGAFLSSLWQPESWRTTTITLGTAAYSAVQARIANAATNAASESSVAYRYVGSTEAQIAEGTGYVPNVTAQGVPKNVFFTPTQYSSASAAQEALVISNPTHVITVDTTAASWLYAGNVEGGAGIEMVTNQILRVISTNPLGL
jgi:RHS repeat-associated protein